MKHSFAGVGRCEGFRMEMLAGSHFMQMGCWNFKSALGKKA